MLIHGPTFRCVSVAVLLQTSPRKAVAVHFVAHPSHSYANHLYANPCTSFAQHFASVLCQHTSEQIGACPSRCPSDLSNSISQPVQPLRCRCGSDLGSSFASRRRSMQYRCVSIQARSEHRPRHAFLVIAIPLLRFACHCSALLLRCSSPLSMPPQGFAVPSHSTSDRCHFYSEPRISTAIRFYSWRFHSTYGLFNAIICVSGAYTVYSMPSLCVTLLCNALALRHVSMLFRRISKLGPALPLPIVSHLFTAMPLLLDANQCLDGSLPVLSMAAPCLPFPSQSQLRNSVSERVCADPSLNTPSSRR